MPLTNLGQYMNKDAPVVVIDANTGKRWPIWVEIDSNATTPADTAMLIHPAKNFASGHRYIVAMRNLKNAAGDTLSAPQGFRYYRDDLPSDEAQINAQRSRFDSIFKKLHNANIKRSNLYLAWDFTVASDENIAKNILAMRNDAFAQLGDTNLADNVVQGTAPSFTVDLGAGLPATSGGPPRGPRHGAPRAGHLPGPLLHDRARRRQPLRSGRDPEPRMQTASRCRTGSGRRTSTA